MNKKIKSVLLLLIHIVVTLLFYLMALIYSEKIGYNDYGLLFITTLYVLGYLFIYLLYKKLIGEKESRLILLSMAIYPLYSFFIGLGYYINYNISNIEYSLPFLVCLQFMFYIFSIYNTKRKKYET